MKTSQELQELALHSAGSGDCPSHFPQIYPEPQGTWQQHQGKHNKPQTRDIPHKESLGTIPQRLTSWYKAKDEICGNSVSWMVEHNVLQRLAPSACFITLAGAEPLCCGLTAAHTSAKLSSGGIQCLLMSWRRRPLTWHQGDMPSFKLAPAHLESLFSGGAAVGSMNNDGRLKLSEDSR